MLKLNASFSKKVPGDEEYSSKGYSASIEIELPAGLSVQEIKQRIHETFELVKNSVECEINGKSESNHTVSRQDERAANNTNNSRKRNGNNGSSSHASPKQIKYLVDLARSANIRLENYLHNYGVTDVRELGKKECSSLIDMIRNQAA